MTSRMTPFAKFICGLATQERIRFLSIGFILAAVAGWCLSFATVERGKTIFGSNLGADFAEYYVAGTILNEHDAEGLYDFSLQDRLYHEVVPAAGAKESLPFVYAPFFAAFVRPLALLPYAWSYFIFSSVSMALFVAGFRLLWISVPETESENYVLANLIAVSFPPFIMECWLGGQASAFAFFSIALAFYLQSRGRRALGGAALAVCLFKPTFLVLFVPMLVLTRQFRTLAGFFFSALALGGISAATVGWKGCSGYIHALAAYSKVKAIAPEVFNASKNVDLYSCLQLALPRSPEVRQYIFISVVLVLFLCLCHTWWRMARGHGNPASQRLSWACALAWTPLLSPHFGIYDSIIVVAAIVLARGLEKQPAAGVCRFSQFPVYSLAIVLYVASWFSQGLGLLIGIQVYSGVLLVLGSYVLVLAACWRRAPQATCAAARSR